MKNISMIFAADVPRSLVNDVLRLIGRIEALDDFEPGSTTMLILVRARTSTDFHCWDPNR